MQNNRFHIIGYQLCPYVQRVVIVMQEKQILYKRTDIELHNKSQWLNKISPTKKVPVLVVNENKALFESSVICDYLDQVSPGSLHPVNALGKAFHCSWIAFGSGILDFFAKIVYQDKTRESFEATLIDIAGRFKVVVQCSGQGHCG